MQQCQHRLHQHHLRGQVSFQTTHTVVQLRLTQRQQLHWPLLRPRHLHHQTLVLLPSRLEKPAGDLAVRIPRQHTNLPVAIHQFRPILPPAPETPPLPLSSTDTTTVADKPGADTKAQPDPPVTDNTDDHTAAPRAEGHLQIFFASFSHNGWAQEQHAEPLYRAVIEYFHRNSPIPFPSNVLHPVGTHAAPTARDVQDLADKTTLYESDDGIVLLVRKPTPTTGTTGRLSRLLHDKRKHIYVPQLMRS